MAINNSKITIQFNTNLTFGKYISFDLISKNVVVSRFTETWNFLRTSNFTVPVLELYYLGQYMSDAFKMQKYFNIDYNSLNQFLVTAFEDTITIESTNPSWSFANFETNSDATATTTQLTSLDDFELTTSEAVESIDNCNYVDINLVSSLNIKKYILNNVETVLNNTNLNITFPRGEDFKIQLFDDNDRIIYYPGQTIHNSFLTFTEKLFVINKSNNYNKLLESNITPNVNVSINGATVQIVVLDADDLDLEYSLNNVNYQESNIFTGQAAGNYTVYVKDKFNCVKSKQYVVDEIGTREPYYYISKINPFNFVKVEDIDNVNTFSNDDNSLNKEGFELNKFCIESIFNSKDNTMMQIKSNYKNISIRARFESLNESIIPVTLKSNNLSRYQKMDCLYYKHSSGKLGIYFNEGNTYNEINAVTGTYSLNGNLPDFANIGNYIELDGLGTFDIYSIAIDKEINKKVILLNEDYNGELTISKIASYYDLLNYNIYEIDINFELFEVGLCDIVVEQWNDDVNDKKIDVSENFYVNEENNQTIGILSFNSEKTNRDIFYKYGIKIFSRFNYMHISGYNKEESEININDQNASSIKSNLKFGDEFIFENLTKKQYEQLSLALSTEFVFINNVGYLKDGELSIENEKMTNLYSLTAKMIKTNESYSTKESGFSGTDSVDNVLNTPTIITDGVNFIIS